MSHLNLSMQPQDKITTYIYQYETGNNLINRPSYKRVISAHELPDDPKILFSANITYVTPADKEKFRIYYPHNNLLQTYLEGCSLAIPRQSLPDEIPDTIKESHEYDMNKSFQILKSLADNNQDSMVQLTLGFIYSNGLLGQTKDAQLTFAYLKRAADFGDIDAKCTVYGVYRDGKLGQEVNTQLAIAYLRNAADLGDKEAQYAIYDVYKEGKQGQEKNTQRAFDYLKRAADQEHGNALYAMYNVYKNGQLDQGQNQERALEYLTKAVNQEHAGALCTMFQFYSENAGPSLDPQVAFNYLKRAADQELATAQFYMFFIYKDGKLNQAKNQERAVEYLIKAADNGHKKAQSIYKMLTLPAPQSQPTHTTNKMTLARLQQRNALTQNITLLRDVIANNDVQIQELNQKVSAVEKDRHEMQKKMEEMEAIIIQMKRNVMHVQSESLKRQANGSESEAKRVRACSSE